MEKLTSAANAVADAFDARVFIYSGGIDHKGFGGLIKCMQPSENQPHRPNTVLFLTTRGGSANAAYQIARLIQNTSKKFVVCIPSFCRSAGTLIALGANEILMMPVSELGPLDVQLLQRDEIGQRRSGLVVRTAFDGLAGESLAVFEKVMLGIKFGSRQAISFETASRIAATIATGVMAPVYAQIDPDALGNDLRDLNVATAYGERLANHSQNAEPGTVSNLVSGYPSHDFIIDKAETETLFKNVNEPSEEVAALVRELGAVVYTEQAPHLIERLDQTSEEQKSDEATSRENGGDSGLASGRKAKGKGNSGGKRAPRKPPESPKETRIDGRKEN